MASYKDTQLFFSLTYWQGFGNTDANWTVVCRLQDVNGVIQAGAFKVSLIDEHQSVTRKKTTVSICDASRHQRPNDQDGFGCIFWILESSITLFCFF